LHLRKELIEYHLGVMQSDLGRSSWRKWLLLPLCFLLPLYLVVLVPLLGCLYIVGESGRRRRALRLRIAMRKARRTSSWADVEADLASGIGTLIVEGPCMGWNDADVWWTCESIAGLAISEGMSLPRSEWGAPDRAELEARMKDPIFDRWCQSRYLDVSRGTARLVQCTHWRSDLHRVRKRIGRLRSVFPRLETVDTHTWMLHMPDDVQRRGRT